MAIQPSSPSPAVAGVVSDLMLTYRSLPRRPTVEEVEASMSVVRSGKEDEAKRVAELGFVENPDDVPEELFAVLMDAKREFIELQALEHRREAEYVLELDRRFQVFDDLIQRASRIVSGGSEEEEKDRVREVTKFSLDKKKEEKKEKDGFRKPADDIKVSYLPSSGASSSGDNKAEQLSLIQVAHLIEASAKKETKVLDLRGKLADKIEWLPVSLGKLGDVTDLDLSENRIMALPSTVGDLRCLTKLDVHSNQLVNLPESLGELLNLTYLDLHANRLKGLPASFGKLINLVDLDLSSNELGALPDSVGNLINLQRLNAETNELEELPYTIGFCAALVELRLDFNKLKALPEAIGKLRNLEILTLHYNRIKGLPTTMGSLSKLRELDVSFNELESIPESFCFATSIVKLNVGRNFADLTSLPRSIGNLELLDELDISSNQIRVLPDSFASLSNLRVFHADETPLEVPPREVVKMGAQAVVRYMTNLVAERETTGERKTVSRSWWLWLCRPRKKAQKKQVSFDTL